MAADGRINIGVSDDNMEAFLSIQPAGIGIAPGSMPVSREAVEEILSSLGIVFGIDWNAVEQAVESFTAAPRLMERVLVAKGKPPVEARGAYPVFHPRIRSMDPQFELPDQPGEDSGDQHDQRFEPKVDTASIVDHREHSAYFIVKKDQVIALLRPPRDGEFGTSVTGEMVSYGTRELSFPQPGTNIRVEEDRIVSDVDGLFVFNKNSYWLETVLEIGGDIGYSTGNIRFPGELRLRGKVQDRFTVWVGGNFTASSTLDCWDVFCGGSLSVNEGIIGRGKSQLRVKGDLEARFMENCNAEVLGSVHVHTGILNSHVFCNQALVTGDRGRLVGGRFIVRDKIDTFFLGNEAEHPTEIIIGMDFVLSRKIDYYTNLLRNLAQMKDILTKKMNEMRSRKLQDQYQVTAAQHIAAQEKIAELMNLLETQPTGLVLVRGTLYPRAKVRFGSYVFEAEKPTPHCKLFLQGETVVCESL